MSTISVDNAKPSSGGTAYSLTDGVAKAWVNFNGTGAIATRDSYNVSSLTDNGVGDYTVSLTNGMSDVNFAFLVTREAVTFVNDNDCYDVFANRTTGSFRIISVENNAVADASNINSSISGNLA